MPRVLLLPSANGLADTARLRAALRSRAAAEEAPAVDAKAAVLLRRAMGLRKTMRSADCVHAIGAAALAAAVLGGARRIVFDPAGVPTRRLTRWLRAIGRHRHLHVIASSEMARRRLVTGGVPIDHCTLIRPGVDLGAVRVPRDDAVRESLGFAAGDVVLMAPLEELHTGGRGIAFWTASLLNVLDPKYKLLLTRSGPAEHPTDALRERLIDPAACVIAETDRLPIEHLFSAADVVMLPATGPVSMATVAGSMASGRPVVAGATRQLCELLEDRHNALLVRDPTPRRMARRVLDALEDVSETARCVDRARAAVYESLTLAKAVELYRQVYAGVGETESDRVGIRDSRLSTPAAPT